jgi:hypothetical protein
MNEAPRGVAGEGCSLRRHGKEESENTIMRSGAAGAQAIGAPGVACGPQERMIVAMTARD